MAMPASGLHRLEVDPGGRKRESSLLQSRALPLLLAFFLFILVLAFVFGDRGIVEIVRTKRQIRTLQRTIADLEAEKARLTREIEQLRASPLALEKKARQDLWLMKADEKVVVLVPDAKEAKHE
jgi:cell division protein FtsB